MLHTYLYNTLVAFFHLFLPFVVASAAEGDTRTELIGAARRMLDLLQTLTHDPDLGL